MKRNIQLTLEEAKKLYKEGDSAMKSLILTSFTENELNTVHFSEIKSFEDACEALGMADNMIDELASLFPLDSQDVVNHLIAIYKIDIIHKALNGDWKPGLVKGDVYWPYIRFYSTKTKAAEAAIVNNWKVCQTFYTNSEKYFLVGGHITHSIGGLSGSIYEYGNVNPYLGLLGCKNEEIARHMSIYFAKEIFEACYVHHVNLYKWE